MSVIAPSTSTSVPSMTTFFRSDMARLYVPLTHARKNGVRGLGRF
jgi:hypothetical protein